MSTRQKRHSQWRRLPLPIICACLIAYFGYHAQTGRYSIYTKAEMQDQAEILSMRLSGLRKERTALENRVRQLTIGSLERDALDAIARSELGYVAEDEMIVFY